MSLIKKFSKKLRKSANSEYISIPTLSHINYPYYSMPPNNITYNCNSDSFESSETSVIDFNQKEEQQKILDKMLYQAHKVNFSFEKISITTIQGNSDAISALTVVFTELENENFKFRTKKPKLAKMVTRGPKGLKVKKFFK